MLKLDTKLFSQFYRSNVSFFFCLVSSSIDKFFTNPEPSSPSIRLKATTPKVFISMPHKVSAIGGSIYRPKVLLRVVMSNTIDVVNFIWKFSIPNKPQQTVFHNVLGDPKVSKFYAPITTMVNTTHNLTNNSFWSWDYPYKVVGFFAKLNLCQNVVNKVKFFKVSHIQFVTPEGCLYAN